MGSPFNWISSWLKTVCLNGHWARDNGMGKGCEGALRVVPLAPPPYNYSPVAEAAAETDFFLVVIVFKHSLIKDLLKIHRVV